MNKRIRIGAVSYLNTRPLIWGIKNSGLISEIDLTEDYPAKIAEKLINDEIDAGLIPVAMIPALKDPHIISDFCIGAEGDVASVAIFSDVPIEQIEKVLLDYQSRTSVNLARVLLKYFWKKEVFFEDTSSGFRDKIKGTTAGVVIGDRALEQLRHSAYVYDLAGAWKKYTGLPFVFAAWVANKKLDAGFINDFNQANEYGLAHLDEIIPGITFDVYDLQTYYTQNLSYSLTDEKRKGLELFLKMLNDIKKEEDKA